MPFLSTYIDIHLIPKWRRPRMIWVELHENEASRATEHKRFYTISLLTGSQRGRKKIRRASEWESERRDSASEASGTRGSL